MPLHSAIFSINARCLKSRSNVTRPWQLCRFSSEAKGPPPTLKKTFQQPSLNKPLHGIPKAIFSNAKEDDYLTTKVTTLSNGIRVASEDRFGQFCTVGVVIDSGSRYEVAYPSGISHFLEKLAFSSTKQFENRDRILKEFEKFSGICDCQSTRDAFIYAASADRRGLDSVINVLADVVLRPRITLHELEEVQNTIKFEIENLMLKPEQELIITDMIHAAAYRDNTLGLPKLCPAKSIHLIDQSVLFTYLKNHYVPSRMVVAGVGVEHDALVETVQKHFVEKKTTWEEDPTFVIDDKNFIPDTSVAQYTGGIVQEKCTIPQFAGPSGLPELAHVMIGLEGTSHQDEDFVPLCVLNVIMGGGGSFSAGGPGKGMYTRLYTNVLNRHHWLFSATAYNHSYADSGLFCIHASTTPSYVADVVGVVVKEMLAMAGPVDAFELSRAKKQLQSMLLMNLEARPVIFEDMARQVLATGKRKRPQMFIDEIGMVSEDDIIRVAQKLLCSVPSVAARGDIAHMPPYERIHASLAEGGINKAIYDTSNVPYIISGTAN